MKFKLFDREEAFFFPKLESFFFQAGFFKSLTLQFIPLKAIALSKEARRKDRGLQGRRQGGREAAAQRDRCNRTRRAGPLLRSLLKDFAFSLDLLALSSFTLQPDILHAAAIDASAVQYACFRDGFLDSYPFHACHSLPFWFLAAYCSSFLCYCLFLFPFFFLLLFFLLFFLCQSGYSRSFCRSCPF